MGAVLSRTTGSGEVGRDDKEYEPLQRIIERDLDMDITRELPAQLQTNELVEESSEVPSPTTPERRPHADAREAPAALSEAAAEALERYKRSAAAAATAAEQQAASGMGNTQMQAANDQLPLPKRGRPRKPSRKTGEQPAAAEEAQKSLKRKAQAAPPIDEPGERLPRKDACSAPGAPEQAAQAASVGNGQKHRSAATPGRKRHRRSTAYWSYPAAALSRDDAPTERWVHCPDGRSYPSSFTYEEGDIPLESYKGKTDDSALYEVDFIIDERRHGNTRNFRVKWKGFEMNPEEWIPYKNLGECEAMDVWEKRLGIVDA
ncbi:hypothetical protein CVIRNUC_004909 [Coccomyxa viridis]|uniref:Chromo domain-containing protein n=1 Tax=Coccomyxa viridis TaxID=1274662 RepID=A0AAV1I4K1_9CHLO|nr:hypothetical protein CVIRNUC_004909 [Coccomyxa viridis]